jgi:hypothetical protein
VSLNGIAAIHSRIAAIEARCNAIGGGSRQFADRVQNSGSTNFADVLSGVGNKDTGVTSTTPASGVGTSNYAKALAKYGTFANDLLTELKLPGTEQNIRAVVAWATAEGTKAANNPLATTRSAPGATNFNSVGVKNYATYTDGLRATVDTIHNGRYTNIIEALTLGRDAHAVASAVAASPWGTGNRMEQVLASFDA